MSLSGIKNLKFSNLDQSTEHSFSRHVGMFYPSILLLLEKSFSILKYPHLLSLRTHGRQDLVVTMGETLFSEDTCKKHIDSEMSEK